MFGREKNGGGGYGVVQRDERGEERGILGGLSENTRRSEEPPNSRKKIGN